MGPASSSSSSGNQTLQFLPDVAVTKRILDEIATDTDEDAMIWRCELLLSQRPDSFLNKGYPADGHGMTPLIASVLKDRPTLLVHMLRRRGVDVDARGICGTTALHTACQQGSTLLVRTLLEHGASPQAEDINKQTALHYAAQCVKLSGARTVQLLLTICPDTADVHAVDRWGRTPLHYACMVHNLEMAAVFLEHGSLVDVHDHSGKTPAALISHERMREDFVQSPLYQLRTFASAVVVEAPRAATVAVARGGSQSKARRRRSMPGRRSAADADAVPEAVPIAEPLRSVAPYSAALATNLQRSSM